MATTRSVRSFLGAGRRAVDVALAAAVIALLVRFGLQFHHPAKWDALWLVMRLRRWGDPLLAEAASWLGATWPSATWSFLPLGLGFGAWIVRGFARSGFDRGLRFLEVNERLREEPLPAARPPHAPPVPHEVPPPTAAAAREPTIPPGQAAPPPAQAPDDEATKARVDVGATGTMVVERPDPAKKAERIGRYEIIEELGRGAMGVVYKARDPQIGRTVGIKAILAANLSGEAVEKYKRRFYVEAQAAGKLSHPGIVTVHDLTEDQAGQPCMVMEFVEGTTLEKMVAAERLPLPQILDVVIQVAYALDYAHARGVVHRDIKPANILVTKDGKAKVSDFGIAKMAGIQLTQTGQILGTPAFMSPEQFMGAAVDARSDIFSLGSMLYWLCTGEKAFPGETITAISFKVVHMAPVPARQLNPALPAEIDFILSRCLSKSPDERYQTGRALAADLEACRAGRPLASAQKAAGEKPGAEKEANRPRE